MVSSQHRRSPPPSADAHTEFTNVWETAYDVTDTTFDCNVNRTNGDTSTQMYLINHFLDKLVAGVPAPDPDHANTTNAVSGTGSLGQQVSTCASQYGRNPNFMLVDVSSPPHAVPAQDVPDTHLRPQFYEYGNGSVFQVAADANGVTYSPATAVATPKTSSSSSSTGSSASVTSTANGALDFRIVPTQVTAAAVVAGCMALGAFSLF